MGVGQENVYALGATQITLNVIGASVFPTKITAPAGCCGMDLIAVSGGSINIVPNASGITIAGGAAASSLLGFPLSTSPYRVDGPASFYAGCMGQSSGILGINFRFSSGGATLV